MHSDKAVNEPEETYTEGERTSVFKDKRPENLGCSVQLERFGSLIQAIGVFTNGPV